MPLLEHLQVQAVDVPETTKSVSVINRQECAHFPSMGSEVNQARGLSAAARGPSAAARQDRESQNGEKCKVFPNS